MQAHTLENSIINKDQQYYKELINYNNTMPHYTLTGSGCRQIAALMKYPIYRICICFGLITLQTNNIFSFMITASHNPATDNGIKIGFTNGSIISKNMFKVVQQCLNSEDSFQLFLSDKLKIIKNINQEEHYAFIGRDCRSSSPQLTQVAYSTLKLLGIKVINLGICSTPQLFSFSQYILKNEQIKNMEENNIQKLKQIYVDEVMGKFQQVYDKITQKSQETNHQISMLLDFSNGSGAISYLRYKEHLGKYFHIKQIGNKQFNSPNDKCGAQFYTKNWNIVQNSQQFKQFSQCFFFDGDSDRVICKTQSCQRPFDGNYFLVFYVHALKKIKDELKNKIKIDWNKYLEVLKLNAIGTSFTNLGVKLCLKKIDISLEISEVGTLNLFRSATQLKGITVFFQPNGHGGVYFSQSTVKMVHQMKQLYPDVLQLTFLDAIHNILKNNSRGYGLHNMLLFFLCKKYLNNLNLSDLIIFAEQDKKCLNLKPEYDKLFKNGVSRNNQLSQPNQIVLFIDQLRARYEDYEITTRKSQTQKFLVRIITQGLNINTCKEINRQIQQFFNNFGYLSQKINDH